MYAIIQAGGKQYKVSPGMLVKINSIPGNPGEEVVLKNVYLFKDGDKVEVGNPVLDGVSVSGEIVCHDRFPKVVSFKRRAKKGYKRMVGHRQNYTEIRIKEIKVKG